MECELSVERAKTIEMENRLAVLSNISKNIVDLSERLTTLFGVLEETANTGVGKKIGGMNFKLCK